jgi:type IV pilus assembly protein PilC
VTQRVPGRGLAVFTRQLAVMVDAGLPLVPTLDLLAREEPHGPLASAVAGVKRDVERGASLSAAMSRHPDAFDRLYTSMVAAGEASGTLDTILQRLATFIEKRARLAAQVRSALVYPAVVLAIAVVVVALILWQVVPTFTALYGGLNATLPLPTRVVIWISRRLFIIGPVVAGVAWVVTTILRRYRQTRDGGLLIDRLVLELPYVGGAVRKVLVARFCRTLGTLLASGVSILQGLDITARAANNAVMAHAIADVRVRIERGQSISRPLAATGAFPPMVTQMVAVGERTGTLDRMLTRAAEFYEDDVEVELTRVLTMLEPALIAVLGVVVGGIVVSMYLPLVELVGQLS